ncbi:MAG: hypothetical protein GC154_17385 [bacterium]|nr:hypothetical protein [bacterium]
MASDEAIKKMIQTIMDRRKSLGLLDWGVARPEDVIDRINRSGEAESASSLADPRKDHHNSGLDENS